MIERLLALIVDEGKWLTASMALALLSTGVLLYRQRRPARQAITAAMNLVFAVTIGTMALGHLLAVTTKLAVGTLDGSVAAFYLIGLALAAPSWWLVGHALRLFGSNASAGARTLWLNAWLSLTVLALGMHNLPLAAPGFLNLAYQLHSRRRVGWAILGFAVVVQGGLFIASLVFMSTGQTFEQFRGG